MRLLLAIAFALTACASYPLVEVSGTTFAGDALPGSVSVFRGIPYAKPPVGALRWQRPEPPVSSAGKQNARAFAPACMQSPRILDWYRDLAETFGASRSVFEDLETSEDCLYLNIWTPDLESDATLPVMVYIHGGSNNSGWAYEPNYHGRRFAEQGVVLVSVAYRLGVFGFFSHPELDDANFGLWDQLAALEWIQANIAHFGGDQDRVTVFGESAGAQDILALMATPAASGLFHGAILQSNAGFGIGATSSPSLAEARQRGEDTAALFGFSEQDSLAELRSVPAAELLARYEENFGDYYHSPIVDGELLDKSVWETVADGELAALPFIIGTNADEYYAYSAENADESDIAAAVAGTEFLNHPDTLAAVSDEADPREAIDRVESAEGMLCPSQLLASNQTSRDQNAWVYYFSRIRDGTAGKDVRAYHGAELPYVFGTHDPWMTTTATDELLTETMMQFWINFATRGNPNGDALPNWPAFTAADDKVMEFGDESTLIAGPEPLLCALYRRSLESTLR